MSGIPNDQSVVVPLDRYMRLYRAQKTLAALHATGSDALADGYADLDRTVVEAQVQSELRRRVAPDDKLRERVRAALIDVLGGQDAYHCTRDWSAWGYGTMGADDFVPVTEDDGAMDDVVNAVLAAIAGSE